MHNSTAAHLNLRTGVSFETDFDGVLTDPQNTGFQWDDYDGAIAEYDDSAPQSIPQHDLINILGGPLNV